MAPSVDECMPCADPDPSNADAKRLCDHICQYAAYVEQSRALGDDHAQPSLVRSICLNVLKKLGGLRLLDSSWVLGWHGLKPSRPSGL